MRGKGALVRTLLAVALVSFLYGLSARNANALEMVYPSGLIMVFPEDNSASQTTRQSNPQQPQKTKSESASVPQKHYNWIKPNKYRDWQCAYELLYNGERPYGFKLYVDRDGDNKPDYFYEYFFKGYNAFYGGLTYKFELDTSSTPVGGGWKDNGEKAMNVCGSEAMKKFFYESEYYSGDPSDYEIEDPDYDIYYPEVTFEER